MAVSLHSCGKSAGKPSKQYRELVFNKSSKKFPNSFPDPRTSKPPICSHAFADGWFLIIIVPNIKCRFSKGLGAGISEQKAKIQFLFTQLCENSIFPSVNCFKRFPPSYLDFFVVQLLVGIFFHQRVEWEPRQFYDKKITAKQGAICQK